MSDVTKEQILRLEKVGMAIADSIENEFKVLEASNSEMKNKINSLFEDFGRIVEALNEKEVNDAE